MKAYSRFVCLLIVLFLISSCAPVATPTQEATTPEPQPASVLDFHPLDTRTGIEEIDVVLDAIANADIKKQRALINYTTAPCTFAEGLGGPPKCREAETEGTEVKVLPFLGPEGSYLREDESIEWGGVQATAIYAIYRVSENVKVEQYNPAGEYAIIFVRSAHWPAVSVRVHDGGIARVDYLFDASPEALNAIIEREVSEVILAPIK